MTTSDFFSNLFLNSHVL